MHIGFASWSSTRTATAGSSTSSGSLGKRLLQELQFGRRLVAMVGMDLAFEGIQTFG